MHVVLSAAPGQTVLLSGMGGIGKSSLAASYAVLHSDEYQPVWWIRAGTHEAVDSGLAELAEALQPDMSAVLSRDGLRGWALQWLTSHYGWLLVLDGVSGPDEVRPLLARAQTGSLILTSRATGWSGEVREVRLSGLPPAAAEQLLKSRGTGHIQDAEYSALSEKLGYLPLAIEQAGAYIAEAGITPAAYLERFDAMQREFDQTGTDKSTRAGSVLKLTLTTIEDNPGAVRLLQILAFLGDEPLPLRVVDSLGPWTEAAIKALSRMSLVSVNRHDRSLRIHPLVQKSIRDGDLPPSALTGSEAYDLAVGLLADSMPDGTRPSASWRNETWQLIPHVEALAAVAEPALVTLRAIRLFEDAGAFLRQQGEPARAVEILRQAGERARALLGPDSIEIASYMTGLASAYQESGDNMSAIGVYEAVLADRERLLGVDHPDTLSSRSNLAAAYQAVGDLGRAIALYEATLADAERVLGSDYPNTLTSRSNLAAAYQAVGDLGRAIALYEATLADAERVLGPDHPNTLTSRNNLAAAYRSAGDLRRAIVLYEATLADRERVLGPDHPNTLTSRSNLAEAYQQAGDLGRAIVLYEATLAGRERVLGPDHPNTLTSRNDLAMALGVAGRTAEAAETDLKLNIKRDRADGAENGPTSGLDSADG